MKYPFYALLFSLLVLVSCERAFVEPGPDASNQLAVFDEFADIINDKYAMFETKGVNWSTLSSDKRLLVKDETSNEALFEILGDMAVSLRDGHTDITDLTRDSTRGFDILDGADLNFAVTSLITHLKSIKKSDFIFFMEESSLYLKIAGNIGYIHIPSFNVELTEEEINTMLTFFKDTKGLIIDVRMNTGGDPAAASLLARHLTDKTVETGFERFKTGPGQNDFSDSPGLNKKAESGEIYTKPIMVLTNGLCYSATTTFIYQTNPLDHVTFIGSRTGGGSGSVADGFLSNGFKYALSVSEFIDNEGRHLDNGVEPDIEVWIDEDNKDIDEVLQRAIDELN